MLSRAQQILLKRAQREAGLSDDDYRDALETIAGCRTSKSPTLIDHRKWFTAITKGWLPNPLSDETEVFGPEAIERERNQIKKEFLFDIPKFGVVIRRASKEEFEQRLKHLKARLELYTKALQKNISDHLNKAKEKLKTSLLEVVTKNPPPAWRKFMDGGHLSAAEAGRLLDGALENAFDGIISDFKPTIRWIYKDVTYETHPPRLVNRALDLQNAMIAEYRPKLNCLATNQRGARFRR